MAALRLRLALLAGLVAAAGCGYFRPTEPEIPTSPPLRSNYSHPDSSLESMNIGLGDKSTQGSGVYMTALAESISTSTPGFHQLFWPEDIVDWSGVVPSDWNWSFELRLYSYLIDLRPLDTYRLIWADGQTTDDIDFVVGVAQIQRRYRVVTYNTDGDSTIIAIGFADLTFYRDAQSRWVITRWADRSDPEADPGDQDQVTLGRRRLQSQSN